MPTVAELEEQLQQARAAEEQAKQQLAEQARREKIESEIMATNEYLNTLQQHLAAVDVTAEVELSRIAEYGGLRLGGLKIPDLDQWSRSIELDHRSHGYGQAPTYQFTVGSYGNRKTFPRLKDGTFKYDRIVEDVTARVRHQRARNEREARERANRTASEGITNALIKQFELPEHTSAVSPSASNPEQVRLRLDTYVSQSQAESVLRAAIDAGVKV